MELIQVTITCYLTYEHERTCVVIVHIVELRIRLRVRDSSSQTV